MNKKKILVIDDEAGFGLSIKYRLEKTEKYDVQTETKGAHGLTAAKTFKPDIILLDVIIPDKDGGEVAFQLKNDPATKDIPIVFLTAIATEKDTHEYEGIIAGHPFITKSANMKELIEVIEKNFR